MKKGWKWLLVLYGTLSVDMADAIAILKGLNLAQEFGLSPISTETDSSMVVNLILTKSPPPSDLRIVIYDIFELVNS
ncbi:hypothetical protein ACOSQ3_029263 [Xanthoceras sorbifolium]